MKILILSQSRSTYTTNRLFETAKAHGHRVRVIHPLRASLYLSDERAKIGYRGKIFSRVHALLPRIGPAITIPGTAVVRHFESMGVYSANSAAAIQASRDKLRCLQILTAHHIPIPDSAFVRERGDIISAIEQVGGVPVVIKLLEGSQGIGVMLAESLRQAQTIIETLLYTKQNLLVQRFIAESRGRDIRAFVVGDRVVAAMRRRASGDEFRSNVHCGATTEPVVLDPAYERVAVRTAQLLGVRIGGVDILESNSGPRVIEVNSSPGMEGIERTTKVDIADAVITFIAKQARTPEVDLAQYLPQGGIDIAAKLRVPADFPPDGKSYASTDLAGKNVLLLSLHRRVATNGNASGETQDHECEITSNPGDQVMIYRGDELLCYGRREFLEKHPWKRAHARGDGATGLTRDSDSSWR